MNDFVLIVCLIVGIIALLCLMFVLCRMVADERSATMPNIIAVKRTRAGIMLTMEDGTQYCGSVTLWRHYPSAERVSPSVRMRLDEQYTRWQWAESAMINPDQPVMKDQCPHPTSET